MVNERINELVGDILILGKMGWDEILSYYQGNA